MEQAVGRDRARPSGAKGLEMQQLSLTDRNCSIPNTACSSQKRSHTYAGKQPAADRLHSHSLLQFVADVRHNDGWTGPHVRLPLYLEGRHSAALPLRLQQPNCRQLPDPIWGPEVRPLQVASLRQTHRLACKGATCAAIPSLGPPHPLKIIGVGQLGAAPAQGAQSAA